MRTLRLCFVRPRVLRIPFLVPATKKYPSPKAQKRKRFIYVGRISEQKHLDALLYAYKLLETKHPEETFELEVHGYEDRLGSPEFGIPPIPYLRFLKKLAKRTGVRNIKWMGFSTQSKLNKNILSRPHIFISPSLHIGENFGMAAYRSLLLGNPAVLSHWGGHRDLKTLFNNSVHTVPVRESRGGHILIPSKFAPQ